MVTANVLHTIMSAFDGDTQGLETKLTARLSTKSASDGD